MVAKEVVLILCFFRVQLISAGFEKLQQRPGCHSQTIFCPCTDRQGLMKWYVAVKTCDVDPNETSSVCKGEAVSTKCRTAYLSSKRYRRSTGDCVNGTIPASTQSSALKGPPRAKLDGSAKTGYLDHQISFKCTVFSNLSASVTWLFNGKALVEEKDKHSFSSCRRQLEIRMLSRKDAGNYTCVVENEKGRATATVKLSIIIALKGPHIDVFGVEGTTPRPKACAPGSPCPTTGRPAPYQSTELLTENPLLHERFDQSNHHDVMSAKIIGIVTGSVLVLVVIALFCFANKERWMLLFSQSRSTLQHDPESLPSEPALAQSNHQPQGTSENREVAGCAEITETTAEIGYEAKYDLFICYSNKDVSWVEELLTKLEERGFLCCIDYRDFTPGAPIMENIAEAIFNSRKTMAVLSPDFINSNWCNRELQQALSRIKYHQVVPILYKKCDIPLVLLDRTYLDWENCHVKPYFWDQLEKALRKPNGISFEQQLALN